MASGWTVEVLNGAVEAEIRPLPADVGTRLAHIIDLLEELGPARVGMPHTRPLGDKLWEIRVKGRDGIARTIHVAASGRRPMLLRVFRKKAEQIPRREIELALRRAKEVD